MTLTKAKLVQSLIDQNLVEKYDAKDFVDQFFALIVKTLMKEEKVNISGFGCFETRRKGARPGRNPRTGEQVTIKERRVVVFRVSPKLKDLLKNLVENDIVAPKGIE